MLRIRKMIAAGYACPARLRTNQTGRSSPGDAGRVVVAEFHYTTDNDAVRITSYRGRWHGQAFVRSHSLSLEPAMLGLA